MVKKKREKEVTRSVGAVVLSPDGRLLLIFQNKGQFWEFPKGKVEEGEEVLETLNREIEEETGIANFDRIDDFKEKIFYHFYLKKGKRIDREVIYYLIVSSDDVKISDEHKEFKWVQPTEAIALLQHQNHKDLVRKAVKLQNIREV